MLKNPDLGWLSVAHSVEDPAIIYGLLFTVYFTDQLWMIQSVFVWEKFRRKGIMTALFKNLFEKAKAKGVKTLILYSNKSN